MVGANQEEISILTLEEIEELSRPIRISALKINES